MNLRPTVPPRRLAPPRSRQPRLAPRRLGTGASRRPCPAMRLAPPARRCGPCGPALSVLVFSLAPPGRDDDRGRGVGPATGLSTSLEERHAAVHRLSPATVHDRRATPRRSCYLRCVCHPVGPPGRDDRAIRCAARPGAGARIRAHGPAGGRTLDGDRSIDRERVGGSAPRWRSSTPPRRQGRDRASAPPGRTVADASLRGGLHGRGHTKVPG